MSVNRRELYVTFKIDQECYGILIDYVASIEKIMHITRIPNTPDYVEGVINLRGEVIALINLRGKLNLPPREFDKDTRIIIVRFKGVIAGIIVDSSSEVREVFTDMIDPPPSAENNENLEYVKGIAKTDKGLLTILKLSKFLDNKR